MGATLQRRLRSDISTTEALIALNRYVFDELGFSGNTDDYYDPRNSYLNDVIDRKLGIPITLVGALHRDRPRASGCRCTACRFPSHFLVKCALREGAIILDPYARGASLGVDDLQERLKAVAKDIELDPALVASLLGAASPNDIFARMLRNLRAIYAEQERAARRRCRRRIASSRSLPAARPTNIATAASSTRARMLPRRARRFPPVSAS